MTYYTGLIAAVPTANRQKYIEHAAASWPVFQNYGALRLVENWGVDIPHGKVTDYYTAVAAGPDESIVFSWIEWPDRATADTAWQRMTTDEAMAQLPEMPFDGKRMVYGGFEPVLSTGATEGAGYLQGFLLAVPEDNREAYVDMARMVWDEMFQPLGCLGMVENWGVDVPHGNQTDFHRAVKAQSGEIPLFSWTLWPDKATCDQAGQAMEAGMEGKEHPEVPFDGMRMMWGGFEPVFDSASH